MKLLARVKICGLKREDDVLCVNRHLPDFAGFVFAESPRRISPETAEKLAEMLDKRIKRVGVFVNESMDTAVEIFKRCRLDIIQLHGDETPEYVDRMRAAAPEAVLWKAVRIKNAGSINGLKNCNADFFVLDAFSKLRYGGTGEAFDWKIAAGSGFCDKIVIAGGLTALNVREAIRIARPYAVDASSGVETDGYKDEAKIRDFIRAVRCEEREVVS